MTSNSIIIPVHNRAALTRQCLNALLNQTYRHGNPEIIVVDDASTDLTLRLLSGYGDAIKVIHHASNQGFGNSCNAGAAASSGENLIFLNNDTLPQPAWLDALVEYSIAHPAAGAIGSKLLYANDTIQHAGVVICHDGFPRHLYVGFPANHPAVNQSRRFKIVTGACVLLPRARFFEAQGFDSSFRNGYEDVDLCLRLGEMGYEVHYCHESVLYHFESATRGPINEHIEHNVKMYVDRWMSRVVPDDLDYYVEDDLLKLVYKDGYSVVLEVSPYLATVRAEGDELTMERLLNYRSDQVGRLLREMAARTSQQPLEELARSVVVPSPTATKATPLKSRVASGSAMPSAWVDERDADLMHPDIERLAGLADPWYIGRTYLKYLKELAGLQPHERVLEVGCGAGRMAIPVAGYLNTTGGYRGFDIVASSVAWAQNKITARYPNVQFHHADIRNSAYNPSGQFEASEYRFPFDDGTFDVVFLASVFTHMLQADVEHYVAEIARVLKPGGRCLASFFILDKKHLRLMEAGKASIRFDNAHGVYRTMTDDVPEAAVAYNLSYCRELFVRNGLSVIEPAHFGNWSGRQDATIVYQDIIVARRQEQAIAVTLVESPVALRRHDGKAPLILNDPRAMEATETQAAATVPLVASRRRYSLNGGAEGILVSVLMPVKNGAERLRVQLPQLVRQRAPAQLEIIAVDSASSDDTVDVLLEFGATVLPIDPASFNHGLTRNLLAACAHGEILVFLNQTALPANDSWLANLIAPLQTNPKLAGVCSRVIPYPDADPLVYREVVDGPSGSPERQIRAIEGWKEFHRLDPHQRRLRLNFHSVSAAVRPGMLALFPFRSVRGISEDIHWAKDVLLAGYQLQHEPTSMVFHSNSYSLAELFQRNVDDGSANLDIVDRRLDVEQVMPAAWAQAVDDSQYLREAFAIDGDELLDLQLNAFLRRTVQFAGQWVGSHDDQLDAGLLPALSRVARMKRTSPSNDATVRQERRRPFPSPDMLFRVTGSREVAWFEQSGRMAVEDFTAALTKHGVLLADFKAVYDFGCGCGRLLRHLMDLHGGRLSGSDIDEAAIRWVQANLPLVDARVNGTLPPLPFESEAFDLVLGYSVFTHLDETYQDAWLSELHRITAPGAWLLLTVHGEAAWQAGAAGLGEFAMKVNERRQEDGFAHWRDGRDDGFPAFYGASWHTPAYIRGHWSRWFTVVDVMENRARPSHDLVVLRRK